MIYDTENKGKNTFKKQHTYICIYIPYQVLLFLKLGDERRMLNDTENKGKDRNISGTLRKLCNEATLSYRVDDVHITISPTEVDDGSWINTFGMHLGLTKIQQLKGYFQPKHRRVSMLKLPMSTLTVNGVDIPNNCHVINICIP